MKKRGSVPKTQVAKTSDHEFSINFSLTKAQFLSLLKTAYLGEYVVNGYRTDDRVQEYENIEQFLLFMAEKAGFKDLVEYSNDLKMYFPTSALDDMLMPLIDEFQNESLWDELVQRLARRDTIRKSGIKAFRAMSPVERFKAQCPFDEIYESEFDPYGLDRLEIIKKGKGGK